MTALAPLAEGVVALRIASDEDPYLGERSTVVLQSAVDAVAADDTIRAVVVEGGSRYFSAGASRASLLAADAPVNILRYAADVPRLLLALPVPVIAAMAGHALGGGFVLGLWCDIAVLAEESLYGANFMALGFTPGMGATIVLEEAVGAPLGRELLLTGRLVKGRELQAAGGPLAHAVVPRAEVHARAVAIAQEVAQGSREGLVLLKRTVAARRRGLLDRAIEQERAMHGELFVGETTRARIAECYATSGGNARGGGAA